MGDVVTPTSAARSVPPPPPPPPRTAPKFRPPRPDAPKSPGAVSDVGSTVSSIFFKPFNAVFGTSTKKKATSEANYSEASSDIKASEAGFSGYNRTTAKQEARNLQKPEMRQESAQSEASERSPREVPEDLAEVKTESPTEQKAESEVDAGSAVEAPSGHGKPPLVDRRGSSEDSSRNKPSSREDRLTLDTIGGSIAAEKRRNSGRGDDRYQATDNQSSVAGSTYAPSVQNSTAGSSVFSGAASSTFDPQVRDKALKKAIKANSFHLGAEPIVEEGVKYEDDESSVGELNSTGIYDVFAPPGPIGLVVDSTKAGPIVHSLKKTSPMIGLINKGDIIIALDDRDVRKMNAASLTRLMAKKARQPERKFTLMPVEDY
jgi:hypothetical protein